MENLAKTAAYEDRVGVDEEPDVGAGGGCAGYRCVAQNCLWHLYDLHLSIS